MLGEVAELVVPALKHRHGTFAEVKGGHHRVPYPFRVPLRGLELVYDKFNEMAFVAVQDVHLVKRKDFPVDSDFCVPSLSQLVEKFPVMALSSPHKRSEKITTLPFITVHDQVNYLLVSIADHLLAGDR